MDANTTAANVVSKGTGFINGELFTMAAKATGSQRDGTIETSWELSSLPDGFSLLTLVDCTSAGVSPIFAVEMGGGQNLLSLSGGNYRIERTFDYGRYGSYHFEYEVRTSGDQVTSTGVQEGRLKLPPLESAELSLIEFLVPAGPRTLRSFMQTKKITTAGENIPVFVSGLYSPIEGDDDWTVGAPTQVRRSQVEITESQKDNRLSLKYTTVIAAVTAPEISAK